jgi:hypothetical protein
MENIISHLHSNPKLLVTAMVTVCETAAMLFIFLVVRPSWTIAGLSYLGILLLMAGAGLMSVQMKIAGWETAIVGLLVLTYVRHHIFSKPVRRPRMRADRS